MKTYVIDASVILAYLLGDDRNVIVGFSKLANGFKERRLILRSIPLLPLEVGNGLRYTTRDTNLAKEALDKFLNLGIELENLSSSQIIKVLDLSYQLGTSFYDTAYHFLAISLEATFLTKDQSYFHKSKQLGHIELA